MGKGLVLTTTTTRVSQCGVVRPIADTAGRREQKLLIAQISDIHIVEQGRKTLGVAPAEDNLASVIAHINRLVPKPDLVLLTGDVTDRGNAQETANAARLLADLNYPLFIIPGNHDTRESLWAQFGGTACPSRTGNTINYVIDGHDVRLIGMDSTIETKGGGELCDARLNWLEARLAEAPDQPTIVFMHHPPVKCSVPETDVDGFIGAGRLGEIIQRFPSVERILCGHIHLPTHSRWHGTIVTTCPATGMRLGLDLSMENESAFFLDVPGYMLHHWTKGQNLISHTVHVTQADGPYRFEPH